MREELSFRPIDSEDEEFLYGLYASTRTDVHATDLSDREKEQFLRMQFGAQSIHYQSNFPNAKFLVVQLNDKAIGRLYLDRTEGEIHLIDIALLPEYRQRGFGTELMRDIFNEAVAKAKRVTIYVECYNDIARRWYEKLGFLEVEDIQTHLLMEWRPGERDQ